MDNKPARKPETFYIFTITISFTFFIFTLVVIGINLNLKKEIQNQIINRDAETFFLFSMMDRSEENGEDLADVVTPWIIRNNSLTPSLWSSDLQGIIALQVFDADNNLRSSIPKTLIPAALKKDDFLKLQQRIPVSKFHDEIWLSSLFDDPRFIMMDSPVPLLEVIIPVHSSQSGKLESILQYWIEGNSMSKELALLNRNILIQTAIALGIGYLIIFTIFTWTYRQLKAVNRSLYEEIEQRKAIEEELKQHTGELLRSREQLASAQQIAHLGSWEWDVQTNNISCSDETHRIMGFKPEEHPVTPELIYGLIHTDERIDFNNSLEEAIKNGSRFDVEHRIQVENKAVRFVRQRAKVFRDENGRAEKMLGTVQDLTIEKMAEEETQHLRDMLSNIIDSMPTVLIGVDKDGHVTQWNREAEQITGIFGTKAQNKLLTDLLPQLESLYEKLREAIPNQRFLKESKVSIVFNNEPGLFDITMYPLISRQQIEGGVILMNNISERVKLEEMMVQTEKMHTVGGLAAGMAHEINNPLAAIISSLQLMRNRLTTGLAKNKQVAEECGTTIISIDDYLHKRGLSKIIDNVLKEGKRAARIVLNMLDFSRKSGSSLIFTNVSYLLDKSLELASNEYDLKKKFDFRSIRIIKEYDPQTPEISCDESKIQQVFLNILKNGAQAMAMDKTPTVPPCFILRVRSGIDETVRIEIEDNGPGMDEATRKKAFEPFFTTKDVGEGTGLGLSVSYYIISENHGSISIDTKPGKGTNFIIQLPVNVPESALSVV